MIGPSPRSEGLHKGWPGRPLLFHSSFTLSRSVLSDSATLWTCNPPGPSVHGVLQARILEWVAVPCPSPGHLPDPGILPTFPVSPALPGGLFTTGVTLGALPLFMVPPSCITWSLSSSLESVLPLLHIQALCRLLVPSSKYTQSSYLRAGLHAWLLAQQ